MPLQSHKIVFLYLVFTLGVFHLGVARSEDPFISIDKIGQDELLGTYFQYFDDPEMTYSFETIQKQAFITSTKKTINTSFSNGNLWLKFKIKNTSNERIDRILHILKPLQDSLTLYRKQGSDWSLSRTGMMVMKTQKEIRGTSLYFPIGIEGHSEQTFYLKTRSKYGKSYVMKLIDEKAYTSFETRELIIIGILMGALLIIAIYNLFIGFGLRDWTYLIYAASIVCSLSAQVTVRGFTKFYLLDNNHFLQEWLPPFTIALGIITLSLFCIKFLDTKRYAPTAHWIFTGLIAFQTLSFLYEIINTEIFGNYTTNKLVAIGTFVSGFIALYAGIRAYANGNKFARYFIVAWAIYSIGIILYAGTLMDLLPINLITNNAYMVGSFLEVMLLSFALADRYNNLKFEKNRLNENLIKRNEEVIAQKEEIIGLMTESLLHLQSKADLRDNLKKVAKEEQNISLKSIVAELQADKIEDDRSIFLKENIAELNASSISKLKSSYSELTKTDIELASFTLAGLSSKEIAVLRNTSVFAVKKGRQRLRKKLEIKAETNLEEFIRSL